MNDIIINGLSGCIPARAFKHLPGHDLGSIHVDLLQNSSKAPSNSTNVTPNDVTVSITVMFRFMPMAQPHVVLQARYVL